MSRRDATPEEALAVEHETVAAEAAWLDREPGNDPWVPEGAWVPQVGEQVVVRLSEECNHRSKILHATTRERIGEGTTGHQPSFEGVVGRVHSIGDPEISTPRNGHIYAVMFDVPIVEALGKWVGATFAAIELLPLAPERRDGGAA